MTGVVATLIANNIINAVTEQIGSFSLALIAPLCSQ
jgi:hypothetical protein